MKSLFSPHRPDELSPQNWQLLSAYLDGQLSERERSQVEKQLGSSPLWQQGLEELRRTRTMLRSAPKKRAPRNFTLRPDMVQQYSAGWQWAPIFRFSSAFATLLVVISFAVELLPGLRVAAPAAVPAEAPEAAMVQEFAANADAATPAPLILWGGPQNYQNTYASGRGGGGGGGSGGGSAGNAGVMSAPPPADLQMEKAVESGAPQMAAPGVGSGTPEMEGAPAAAVPLPESTPEDTQRALEPAATAVPDVAGQPGSLVLGVRPPQEAAASNQVAVQIAPLTEPVVESAAPLAVRSAGWRITQGILAGVAVLSALLFWLVRKRRL